MKVLIFSIEFPPDVGGAGSYAKNLALGLAQIGHEVTILTGHKKKNADKEERIDNELKRCGQIDIIRRLYIPKLYCFMIGYYYRQLLRNSNYDIIYIADAYAKNIAAYARPDSSIPTWTVCHGSEMSFYFRNPSIPFRILKGSRRIYRFFKKVDGIIAVSNFVRDDIILELPELDNKVYVVHHGINTDFYKKFTDDKILELRKSLKLPLDANILFSASRLIKNKGYPELISAMKEVIKKAPHTMLLVAGDGCHRTYFEHIVLQYGLENNVRFLGSLPSLRMVDYYNACDLFILLSRKEGFGLVYLEANACGRAVVGTNAGGIPEAVQCGVSGVLVNPMDINATTKTILNLLNNDEYRNDLEVSAYTRLLDCFTIETMARKTIALTHTQRKAQRKATCAPHAIYQ